MHKLYVCMLLYVCMSPQVVCMYCSVCLYVCMVLYVCTSCMYVCMSLYVRVRKVLGAADVCECTGMSPQVVCTYECTSCMFVCFCTRGSVCMSAQGVGAADAT